MKLVVRFIVLFVFTTQGYAQGLTQEDFLGTWKAVDAHIMPEMVEMELDAEGKKKMEQMRIGFIGTVFHFGADHTFTMKFPEDMPKFMKELEFLNNKKWKIEEGAYIAIGTAEDGYSLMSMMVRIQQGKTYFMLDETPLVLEVNKQ